MKGRPPVCEVAGHGPTTTVLRKRPPWTACQRDKDYFDYWRCPKCKANYATPKLRGGIGQREGAG